ncbi:MAG: hypothetical protein WCB67_18240, partial [Solirubrobacteraceae bacterium]
MVAVLVIAGCGGSHHRASPSSLSASTPAASASGSSPGPRPHPPRLISVRAAAHLAGVFGWRPAVAVRGQTAVWISRVNARHEPGYTVTLLRLNQRLVTLALHAGGLEPGGTGWRYGDAIRGAERRILVAAFNSAFREGYG